MDIVISVQNPDTTFQISGYSARKGLLSHKTKKLFKNNCGNRIIRKSETMDPQINSKVCLRPNFNLVKIDFITGNKTRKAMIMVSSRSNRYILINEGT